MSGRSFRKFNDPEQLKSTEHVNKVIEDVYQSIDEQINDKTGIIPKNTNIVKEGGVVSNIKDNQMAIEFNDTNKRLLVKINGKMYAIGDLTEV